MDILRGNLVDVSLDPIIGKEKGKTRPCVVVQNDIGNKFSPTTIIVPITAVDGKKIFPFQVFIKKGEGGLVKNSKACCEHVRIIDKKRIVGTILGTLDTATIKDINKALCLSLALP